MTRERIIAGVVLAIAAVIFVLMCQGARGDVVARVLDSRTLVTTDGTIVHLRGLSVSRDVRAVRAVSSYVLGKDCELRNLTRRSCGVWEADVVSPENVWVNAWVVRNGWAGASSIGAVPNIQAMQRAARVERRGLWAVPVSGTPSTVIVRPRAVQGPLTRIVGGFGAASGSSSSGSC